MHSNMDLNVDKIVSQYLYPMIYCLYLDDFVIIHTFGVEIIDFKEVGIMFALSIEDDGIIETLQTLNELYCWIVFERSQMMNNKVIPKY